MLNTFSRGTADIPVGFTKIGDGTAGGKANGLMNLSEIIKKNFQNDGKHDFNVDIPGFTVISTDYFDKFMDSNDLWDIAISDVSDERKIHHFLKTELPVNLVGDLRSIITSACKPLAIRSSSLLEDSLESPFAGVYATKMIANNHPDINVRFKKLGEAIRFIYASTFFNQALIYRKSQNIDDKAEKMAIIIQEVVGNIHSDRFYPEISGVLRTFNYYPTGGAKALDGVSMLALGLGKTVVDGGLCWTYSPEYPGKGIPYNSIKDLMKNTQNDFWAVDMKPKTDFDPMRENEFLELYSLEDSEYDNTIHKMASTYDPASDRVVMGTGRKGPRIIDFAPILQADVLCLNQLIKEVLQVCMKFAGEHVEIEFAATFGKEPRFSLLQIRPMKVVENRINISEAEFESPDKILNSKNILGNGMYQSIRDIVFVDRKKFDLKYSYDILKEIEELNRRFMKSGRRYILIGFGRWGSSDPWLGIGVNWTQISNAAIIVELQLAERIIDFSQGSHFFHNLISQGVGYMSVSYNDVSKISWDILENCEHCESGKFVKHVEFKTQLKVKLDGSRNMGVIMSAEKQMESLLRDLKERAKELNCFYTVDELLADNSLDIDEIFQKVINIIPEGWQFPELCQVKITYFDRSWQTNGYTDTESMHCVDIKSGSSIVGQLCVSYKEKSTDEKCFLNEELKLIKRIADRIGGALLYREHQKLQESKNEWCVILEMIRKSDRNQYIFLAKKMLHSLCWMGVLKAKKLMSEFDIGKSRSDINGRVLELNTPSQKHTLNILTDFCGKVFEIAKGNMRSDQILESLEKWIEEDKSRFLLTALDNPNSSIDKIIDAITKYRFLQKGGVVLPGSLAKGVSVSLIRTFFSEQLEFINIAKDHIGIDDYYKILKRMIYPAEGRGKLGGKSAGLFLASKILENSSKYQELFCDIKTPKTWYLSSAALMKFIYYNSLEEVFEQKYKSFDEIQFEYPNIIQIFKNSPFPSDLVKGLESAIDDLGPNPIIVRSSSLLEDRFGATFSGKYKSLFLANQGSRSERLEALMDCIAEVYSSIFSPDAIEYRRERGLLDFHEEMGIMIQQVIGNKSGDYYFPVFSGVAFSSNEFRWSPRIERKDGLLRIVPGLGTRAVDRVSDDYPILISPGKPDLRVNISSDEVIRYSPKMLDVINLNENDFETVNVKKILTECGENIPLIAKCVSKYKDGAMTDTNSIINLDFQKDELVITFEGIVRRTDIVKQLKCVLEVLEEQIGTPVDIEFSHDGENLYLLQCRPQSSGSEYEAVPIPRDIQKNSILFTANRYISNGVVDGITHVVYVDPYEYKNLPSLEAMKEVGRLVGKLNKILPKKQFILIGPGRWGSRGDIKLGVNITYSDINNTAVLMEVAFKQGNYTPDLSFGTHFFQDLVEAGIKYIPVYPDDEEVQFNQSFFNNKKNIVSDMLPEYKDLENVVKVIDIQETCDGKMLRILMNSELDEAIGYLTETSIKEYRPESLSPSSLQEDFWSWRMHMAEQIATRMDAEKYGVVDMYLIGSAKNTTAGPASDIDLLVHFMGNEEQKNCLLEWLDGWSRALAEINYLKTGYKTEKLLDIHLITDEDIKNKTSFAVKIGAVTDAARKLPIQKKDLTTKNPKEKNKE